MHEAYMVLAPTNISVMIESMTSYDNTVIFGTKQGHLLIYAIEVNSNERKMELQLLQYNKNFSTKPIMQVDVVPDYQLLFCLIDSTISVYDISRNQTSLVHCATKTKGASLFALDVKRSISLTGETAIVCRMCVVVKRKLQLWYWKWKQHDLLSFAPDIDLSDIPKTILWSENTICVGYKTEYVLYDISGNNPAKQDLFPTSSSRTIDPCIALIDNCFAVAKDEFLIAVDPKSKSPHESITVAAAGTAATIINEKEKRETFKSFAWSQPLQILVWDEPYAIALINNSLEVRVLASKSDDDTFVQSLPELQKARLLVRSKKGLLFAASVSQLWCIQAVEIPKQRQGLLQQKKFQLALQLTNISDESDDEKQAISYQIQSHYAFDLFANKHFKESMKEFIKLETDPCDVIRLFPDLITSTSSTASSMIPTPTSSIIASSMANASLPKLENRDLENGLLALIDYLVNIRFKLKTKMALELQTKSHTNQQQMSILSVIDTTLLKCYLQTNDSLVASLLRLNNCYLEESEKTLKKYEKYCELVILYQTKGHHKKALQLLKDQAEVPNSSLFGHERTIQYLQNLGKEHKQLMFEFAGWVLEKYPEDGLRIFTEEEIEPEKLARAEVLDYLLKGHKSLVIPYLEHIIHTLNETRQMFHNILIQQYREQIDYIKLDSKTSPTRSEKRKEVLLENTRSKLVDFLKKSNNYAPESVLKNFPCNELFEERATILGKLGKHEKVLAIFVQILGNIEKAIEYCESVYQINGEKNSNAYIILIRTLLIPPTAPPYSDVPLHPSCLKPNINAVLDVLDKHATKLNPYAVLQILPDNIPLLQLRNFLELALHTQLEDKRNNQVLKGLLYAENLQTQEQRMHHESKSVLITENSVCPKCTKKFTNQSAFVRNPNGKIVHYSCQEKE